MRRAQGRHAVVGRRVVQPPLPGLLIDFIIRAPGRRVTTTVRQEAWARAVQKAVAQQAVHALGLQGRVGRGKAGVHTK